MTNDIRARRWLNLGGVTGVIVAFTLIVAQNAPGAASLQLLNVSYDPTRELYQALNQSFVASYEKETSRHLTIVQSHGGSTRQARRVVSGEITADVVTLGMFSDIDALRKRGLIAPNWADRLPNHSLPYTSTIVFVVRKGNPLGINDWPDLLAPKLEIVMPDPRTSGSGKLAALAAWAATTARGGSEGAARAYLTALYQHVHTLTEGAHDAATTFAEQEIGDVQITWENEAIREVARSKGALAAVYPPISILAEPYVAWVDRNVARDGNLAEVKAYLTFLFSDAAQETIARLGYRPIRAGSAFPSITLVPVTAIARDWDDANEKFFAENGIIDIIMSGRRR
jgi:sulfate transport system substrate-binding protein